MKIAIIGAGNMGYAIACGLVKSAVTAAGDITVSNRSQKKLDQLKASNNQLCVTTDNKEAIKGSDIVILAVKPWVVEEVLEELTFKRQQDRKSVV